MTYLLARVQPVHPTQRDRRTTIMPIARPLLKYGRLKNQLH